MHVIRKYYTKLIYLTKSFCVISGWPLENRTLSKCFPIKSSQLLLVHNESKNWSHIWILRLVLLFHEKNWLCCFKNHQSKTIFTSSIMLNSMSLPCYSEKLSSGDMLKPDPSFRPNPPKVLSRGQNHPPNHLARICCFLCLFIHWSIKRSLTSGSIPML